MGEIKERGLFVNPYVIQMDKFAASLRHLSDTFLGLEDYKGTFSKTEIEEMLSRVTEKVCANCERKESCLGECRLQTHQMFCDILCTVEEYGAELNVEVKRKLQKKCLFAPRFLRETLEAFESAKQKMMWNNKMVQNREGCAIQLTSFANMIQHAARELDAGIFSDEHLEKKIKMYLKKNGIKMLSSIFFVTKQGRYEIHVTIKALKGQCVATKEVAAAISFCVGRTMMLECGERPVIGQEYCTIVCMEGPIYHTLQGVAKIGKGCEKISGDTFFMTELPGGKKGIVLSDGMGSGEAALRESTMVVEMLEELLTAGFPVETAIQMMNTALVTGREELRFSTIDMSIFNLYKGTCEFIKAGASTTFIKRKDGVERLNSSTLPIGVLQNIEIHSVRKELSDGDFVIMVTDGVMDALPSGQQEVLMSTFIEGVNINNPKEMAHHILEQVLEWTGEAPIDDMTIIVIGMWNI